ncbi:unnamed protein product, partial [Prunus brigantina]
MILPKMGNIRKKRKMKEIKMNRRMKKKKDEQKEEEKKFEEKEEEKKDDEKKEEKQDEKEKEKKEDEEKHDDKVCVDYSNMEVPSSLKSLCRYVETTLVPQEKIMTFTIDKEVFGVDRNSFVLPEDITQFAGMEEIGATVVAIYMRFIFMMPYNLGRHWVLLIVRAKRETVYFLDPLPGNRVVDEEGKNIVNSAIKIYNSHIARPGRKAPIWKTLSGTTKQPSSVECGYYVMRFMRDIIMDPSLAFEKKVRRNYLHTFYVMSHPADSPSWKLLDDKWPEFGNELRNLRLALSSDGFNPHSSLSSRYSCWPVILVTYNLPPWLCMKRKFMMLTLLISGPKQPGNDIDVYLEPLIDDLKSLWDGIRGVYDAHNGEYFTLRAALMWTINDFPAYGNLSGCLVKGYKACPICGDDTPSHRLKNGHKICYIGHRKWLSINHPYRRQRAAFNGKPEYGTPPEPLTGEEVLHMVEDGDRVCWKKKSIFFDLEYWKYLPVRHALDVKHIEKNVCDSIIGTLLEIPGK